MLKNVLEYRKYYITLLIFFVFYPLLIVQNDLWDGVLTTFAFKTNNVLIYKTWFNETGWVLVRWLYEILHIITFKLGFSIKTVINLIIVTTSILTVKEIGAILDGFKIKDVPRLYAQVLVILVPFVVLYFSTIFLMHSLMTYLLFLGVRLYLEDKKSALILILISFEHNANPVLLFLILASCYVFGDRKKLKQDTLVLTILALAFIGYKLSFPANGLYQGYNKPSLKHLLNRQLYIDNLNSYIFFYWPSCVLLLVLVVKRFIPIHKAIFCILAIIASMIPYIVVGKNSIVNGLYGGNPYDLRFLMNSCLISCLLFPLALNNSYEKITKSYIFFKIIILIIALQIMLLSAHILRSYSMTNTTLDTQNFMIENFSTHKEELLRGGYVYITGLRMFDNDYEKGWLLFEAIGDSKVYATNGSNTNNAGLNEMQKYKDKYIQSNFTDGCKYYVTVTDDRNYRFSLTQVTKLYLYGMYKPHNQYTDLKFDFNDKGCVK